jgi:hypothetical protein
VPAGQEDQCRTLAVQAAPDVQVIAGASGDDLLFYRERIQSSLASLEQLGPLGEEAYQQMLTANHFTPHSRTDISEWRNIRAETGGLFGEAVAPLFGVAPEEDSCL